MLKSFIKKSVFSFLVTILILPIYSYAQIPERVSEADEVRIDVFVRDDCAHCQDEKAFLKEFAEKRGALNIIYHDVYTDEGKEKFDRLTDLQGIPKLTPVTIIDRVVLQGFSTPETTGERIKYLVSKAEGKKQYTFEEFMAEGGGLEMEESEGTCDVGGCEIERLEYLVNIPFIGATDISEYSLPFMSLLLGFVDGFNPCAMWVLVMFLTILAEVGSKKRMFQMAGLFIFAEAVMYYLILNVWMTTWDFVGLDRFVTPIVGFVAIAAGSYFLYLYSVKDASCKVGSLEAKQRTRNKIKNYADGPLTLVAALGILGIAFSVNIIEFACSIGIPQTFTKILDLNTFSWLGKQYYTFLYIIMYMVDDLIVFALALYSFEKIGLTTHKYTHMSHLIGGLIMWILGLIMLLNPSLLVIG